MEVEYLTENYRGAECGITLLGISFRGVKDIESSVTLPCLFSNAIDDCSDISMIQLRGQQELRVYRYIQDKEHLLRTLARETIFDEVKFSKMQSAFPIYCQVDFVWDGYLCSCRMENTGFFSCIKCIPQESPVDFTSEELGMLRSGFKFDDYYEQFVPNGNIGLVLVRKEYPDAFGADIIFNSAEVYVNPQRCRLG